MKTAIKPLPGFKFGCDPELFVRNREGKIVSAHDLLPGTKDEPYKVEYGAIQVDGTAAEFNIDPASTFEEFDRNIVAVMKTLLKMLPKGYSLSVVPAVKYDQDEWDRIPPSAKVLGCTPDFNAWTSNVNPSPDPVGDLERVRTASGHLHIGWTEGVNLSENIEHLQHCNDLVKQLDWYLGYWSLSQDNDNTRRSLYGKAGACRYKPYGVEYRVLSNFWLSNKGLRLEVWNRMQQAIWDMSSLYLPSVSGKNNDKIVAAINSSNCDLVGTLIFNRAYPLQSINK
jgi:hypothetical protein